MQLPAMINTKPKQATAEVLWIKQQTSRIYTNCREFWDDKSPHKFRLSYLSVLCNSVFMWICCIVIAASFHLVTCCPLFLSVPSNSVAMVIHHVMHPFPDVRQFLELFFPSLVPVHSLPNLERKQLPSHPNLVQNGINTFFSLNIIFPH